MFVTPNFPDMMTRHDNQLTSREHTHGHGGRNNDHGAAATDKLLMQLAKKVPGMTGPEDFKELGPRQFSPEKVADRITGFVAQGLDRARSEGKSEDEIEALYDQAISGIKQGFEEARAILDEMNLLTDNVAETINQTLKLTVSGLEGLAPANNQQSSAAKSGSTSMLAAERFESAESFSLKVRTQDGDKVTIRFNNENSYESSFGAYSDGNGSAASFSVDRSASSSYRFSVEGDLDNDEIDALQNLIKDISNIADDFFDGDIQSAFDQASQFQMDKTELASMHLKLTRSESYSAVAAYQQVQNQDDPQFGQGRKLGHMMNDFAAKVAGPALGFLQSPADFGQEVLSGLIQQDARYKEEDNNKKSLFNQNLDTMRSILDTLTNTEQLN